MEFRKDVNSNNLPPEIEKLQGGILARWNVQETPTEDNPASVTYDELFVDLTASKEEIISALKDNGYDGNVDEFADRILKAV